MSLEEIRIRIDAIDSEIIRLLDARARAGREVGEYKHRLGLPLYHPGREKDVLKRLRLLSDGSMPAESIDAIYRTIMRETLNLQTNLRQQPCTGHQADQKKRDVSAVILENSEAGPGFFRMRLRAAELAGVFTPGQFFQIRVDTGEGGFFLRRPFAPSAYTKDGVEFIYAVVGDGTRQLSRLETGTRVDVLAPLGSTFTPLPAGSGAVLFGGGVGAPSLAPLARYLKQSGVNVTIFIGARTADFLLEREVFAKTCDRLIFSTDDGSHGFGGTSVDAFRTHREECGRIDRIYSIGPIPMLRAVAEVAKELGVSCEVSLEERMACGFGACMGCVVPVLRGEGEPSVFRRVCHDGPVFDANQLAWSEMR